MKKFLISEEERMNILSMHKAMIKEQDSSVDILRKAIQGGCLKNGQLVSSKLDPSKYIYRAKTDNGTDIDFFGDMTYKLRATGKTGKWKLCPGALKIDADVATAAEAKKENDLKLASYKKLNWKTRDEMIAAGVDVTTLDKVYDKVTVGTTVLYKPKGAANDPVTDTSTAEFNQDQKDFLDRYEKKGFILNPTQVERENYVPYTAKQLGARPDLFPNGITLYYNPDFQKDLKKSDADDIGDTLTNQTPPRDVCKIKIENFYNYFRKRNSLLPDPDAYRRKAAEINKARLVVQACKDEYYPKKWGILGGGNKLNEYIEILSADRQGGPSSQGPDKIFRLS
jgi:hypothetical protein